MGYKIRYKNSVTKDLKKIDKSKAKDILDKIETQLSVDPEKNPILKGKFAGLRKFRVGDYRIIYTIIETDSVLVLRIAHRKESYRK